MLKATGIVRKIDTLGRIVLPATIRKNLELKNGVKVTRLPFQFNLKVEKQQI